MKSVITVFLALGLVSALIGKPASAQPGATVVVNGSAVPLTPEVPVTVGEHGACGTPFVDLGSIVVSQNGAAYGASRLVVNGVVYPLSCRVVSEANGVLQYVVDGGGACPLVKNADVEVEPAGGSVKLDGVGYVRIPITVNLTLHATAGVTTR